MGGLPRKNRRSFAPPLKSERAKDLLAKAAQQVSRLAGDSDRELELAKLRADLVEQVNVRCSPTERVMLRAALMVLCDLAQQGWTISCRSGAVRVSPPQSTADNPMQEKARVRSQELIKRDEQLRQPATQKFIRSMERKRLHAGRFVSVFSLMRDGRELAAALRKARAACTNGSTAPFKDAIAPYLQVVETGCRCEHTGLLLQDIWRYFRHTWSTQYQTVPGRSMMLLVRDAAARFHPVIGIAALASPIVQLRERDVWIGWHPEVFVERLRENPTDEFGRWLVGLVREGLEELYVSDFLEDGLLTASQLRAPSSKDIRRLREEAAEARERHHRCVSAGEMKSDAQDTLESQDEHWLQRARTPLYRSKRALALADLLEARIELTKHLSDTPTAGALRALLETSSGRKVVGKLVKRAKAERVGVLLADISVCGAVQPYNAILGGKLVSMLVTSPEVVEAYRDRYRHAQSIIASGMAGRSVVREPDLAVLGTTSLYGVSPAQYNRIKIPLELFGSGGESIRYERLGLSESIGTSQFSDETLEALDALIRNERDGQRVNSIFGEGASPKLRKVRDGLDLLGLPSQEFLRHGRRRVVYGISLVENLDRFLLGLDEMPHYLVPKHSWTKASEVISDWWVSRWLKQRVCSEKVLEQVASHSLVLPIRHGARVERLSRREQPELIFGV